MMLRSGIPISPLILLILLVIGLIFLVVNPGRTRRIIIGALLAVPVCWVLLFTLFAVRSQSGIVISQTGRPRPEESIPISTDQALNDPPWPISENKPGSDTLVQSQTRYTTDFFDEISLHMGEVEQSEKLADIYPSAPSAAAGLTKYLIYSWEKVVPDRKEPTSITVLGDVQQDILGKVVETVREHHPSIPIETIKGTATQPSEEVDDRAVILRISETKDMVSVDAASKSGTPNEVSKSVHVSADQKPAKLALSKRDEKVEISADGIEVSRPDERVKISPNGIEVSKPDERVEISAGDGAFKLEVEKPGKSVNISIGKSLVPKVSVFEENKRGISKIDKVEQGGTVEAVLIGGAGERRKSIRYIDKPWVDNLAEFINRNPEGQWIVAHSTQPMPSREEAERSAAKSAVDQLIPRVQSRVSSRVQDALRPALIEKDIYGMGMIADRFVQSFKRPYGQVWQEYLLVDASTDKLTFLAARQRSAHTRDSYNTLIKQYLPIVGMILLVLVVYGFLNVATRGYYTWSLRIAGIVCVATVVLLILNYA